MEGSGRYDVNLSILLTELPLLQRPQAARDAGFTFGGDMAAGERWLASVPGREEDRDNLDVAVALAQTSECPALHVLYGNRDGGDPERQDELGIEHLARASAAAAGVGAVVLVEALSGADRCPLRTSADVLRVLDRVEAAGGPGPRMLCDLHHLTVNGEDAADVVARHADRISRGGP